MGLFRTFAVVATLALSTASQALLMTAAPLEDEAEAQDLYGPIAAMLSASLGTEVTFEHSRDWQYFSKQIQSGSYDIILAPPHIAAYQTSYNSVASMSLLVRLPGQLQYHVIVKGDSTKDKLSKLQSSRICMLPSPSYSGVILMKQFKNPVSQPTIVEVRGGYDDVYIKFQKKRCHAAVVDNNTYARLTAAGEDVKSIYTTLSSPNFGLTVSQLVQPADRTLIIQTLQSPEASEKLETLFVKYSAGQAPFIDTNNSDYEKFNFLPDSVWGW